MEISPVKNTVFFDGLLTHASSINSKREFLGENFGEKQGIFLQVKQPQLLSCSYGCSSSGEKQ